MTAEPEVEAVIAPTRIDKHVQRYIAVRDELKRRETAYKESIKDLVAFQEQTAGHLQKFFDETHTDNSRTRFGTAFIKTKHSASLADPLAFMDFVIAKSQWDMLDKKANVTAVRGYVEEKNTLPPGVNLSSEVKVHVRRPTKKAPKE